MLRKFKPTPLNLTIPRSHLLRNRPPLPNSPHHFAPTEPETAASRHSNDDPNLLHRPFRGFSFNFFFGSAVAKQRSEFLEREILLIQSEVLRWGLQIFLFMSN